MTHAGDLLVGHVSVARDEDHVAGARLVHRAEDRDLAILDRLDVALDDAGEHLLDDRGRRLPARVVARHDDVIGEARGELAHDRTLARVALAAATEDAEEAPARRDT